VEPGTVLAERFEIERRVSAGGMSAVFRAKDRRLGGIVAIKVLYGRAEGEHRERLFREARILENLRHPGIVRYVAHGETDMGKPYLAMEWIDGETLGRRLSRTGLTMGESVRLVTRVAETLAMTHANGIIHRDIKPANLILRDGNVDSPTLIDFGIARVDLDPSAITNTGVMLGTLGYMAPEQARGTKPLDARADVFALGAVLFKCLTGRPAFAGDDEVAMLAKMVSEAPPRIRELREDVPAALDELLARMLARDRRERPADGGIVAAELAALGTLDGTDAMHATRSTPAVRRSVVPAVPPETVLTTVEARLEALEPEAWRVLRAASVFGQTFWRGAVVALLDDALANELQHEHEMSASAGGSEGARVMAWLDELAVREIVTRREKPKFESEVEYVFRHAFVAEAAYAMLTEKDRTAGHKLAAQWLEMMGESEAIVLAEHLERGGEPKRAMTFYRRAAAQALEANDLEACLARADRGIACGAEGEVLGRLLLRKSEAHRWRGENQKGKECARTALDLLPRMGRRWFLAAGEVVEVCARLGEERELHGTVDDLCEVSSTGQLSTPHLVALARAACVLMAAGNYVSADELLRTIDAAYERIRREDEDPPAVANVYRTRAYRALVSGDTGSALSMFNIAISHFEAAGDARAACHHLVSAAGACIELGSYAEAERALSDAFASAQHMGLSGVSANVWHHQGMLLYRLGDPRSALARADAAIDAFVAQGDRHMEAAARLYRGFFLAAAEDLARAEHEVQLALGHGGITPPRRAFGLAILAGIHLASGRADRAEAPARESARLLETLGGVEEGEAYIRLTYAEALDALGDQAGARGAIATARVRILERTAMMQDAQWKDTFIERVRENCRTLELARAWRVV
jgi:tetratricopeptide (TPR) repeat protein/predicted Ser/Thr protein kinase